MRFCFEIFILDLFLFCKMVKVFYILVYFVVKVLGLWNIGYVFEFVLGFYLYLFMF